MNICYLSRDYPPNLLGGVGTYTYEISRALLNLGHKVFVITEGNSSDSEGIEDGIHVFRIRPKRIGYLDIFRDKFQKTVERLEYSAAVSDKLKKLVSNYKIDIVESCEARAEGFWYYLFHKEPPLVIKLHTPETIACKIDNIPLNLDTRIINKLEEFWIFKSKKIVAVTQAIIDLVSDYYNFRLHNLPVVYYPIDTELFRPNGKTLSNDFPKILYAGRLEIRKGVMVLLEAIPLVLKEFPEAKFYFVGQDAGIKYLMERRISELGCASNIIFTGPIAREKMVNIYRSVDLCVFPSLWENFAYVALEAMACGKAVIASRVGGFLEMIDEGVNGIFFSPGDHKDLAYRINLTLRDKGAMRRIGAAARNHIVNSCSPKEKAEEALGIYKQIISGNKSSCRQ